MNRLFLFSCLAFFFLTANAVTAEESGLTTYECTAAGGLTRQIRSEEHCLAERDAGAGQDACRVDYTKDGVTEILWRAGNDPSFCYPRVRDLISTLEASGFTCTGTDGHIECDDADAVDDLAPAPVESTDSRPGSITITPSAPSAPPTQSGAVSPSPSPPPVSDITAPSERVPQLLRETYLSDVTSLERDYFVYLPGNFSERENWPVMLFLHGNGERGDGKGELDFVMVHGPLYEAWVQKRDLPFVIIAPQLPMYDMGELPFIKNRKFAEIPWRLPEGTPDRDGKFASADSMSGSIGRMPDQFGIEGPPSGWSLQDKELLAMVDTIIEKYRGDPKRVYLTGLSYGGFGAWYMASKYPERFAAVNPIVGYAHPDLVDSIAVHQIPVWCFAGGRDNVVPVEYFYAGMNRLEQLGHDDARLTVEEDMNHDVWTRVYAGEDIYNWMLSQSN